jgi:hypothetical protein
MEDFVVEAVLGDLDVFPRQDCAGVSYKARSGEEALRLAQQDASLLERFPEIRYPYQLNWVVSTAQDPCVIREIAQQ